ncbi:MAG: YihY/virulence factor BrkB family protein [Acidobacteria bacterium]|jgi:membrane protein|nr:YihY/virulence factor BrkB family protein [Acidobacteriota bacterium]
MKSKANIMAPWNLLKSTGRALVQFLGEGGIDKASILAYYSIFSSFFLLIFFFYLFAGIFGAADSALQNVYPFSPDFFQQIAPVFFQDAADLTSRIGDMGLLGLGLFLFLGILVFKKMVQFINDMFFIDITRAFFGKRLKEFGLLFIVVILIVASFLATGLTSTITTMVEQDLATRAPIDPAVVRAVNGFLVRYVLPFLITFLFFYILFKWIPEKKVGGMAALVASLFSALLWELVKRAYTYYLVNISLLKKMQDPIVAIILFGFWMEVTMGIMLYGAKLTFLLDKEEHA